VQKNKNAEGEAAKQKLDLELDAELEATFPASDALKITQPGKAKRAEEDRE
jgi:hypothetical protein